MLKISKIILLLACLFFWLSCSQFTPIFIQNTSAVEKRITVVYKLKEFGRQIETNLYYVEGIMSPQSFQKVNVKKELTHRLLNDSTLVMDIPSNSTARIIATTNFAYFQFVKYIEIDGKRYNIREFDKLAENKKGPNLTVKIPINR